MQLQAIDGARGVAVLAVVVHHAFFTARVEPASLLPFWGNCGARGVDLFFVISGFCLALPYVTGRTPLTHSIGAYRDFLIRRFSRIVPPYYAALALFVALSFTSFGFPGAGAANPGSPATWAEAGREAAFLTSQAPLHNVSFWTLAIEVRWYLLCPLLVALFVRSRKAFFAIAFVLYVLYLATRYAIADEGTLPAFMLGIVAAHAIATASPLVRYARFAAPVVLAIAVWVQSHSTVVDHGDPLWHAACFLILLAIAGTPSASLFTSMPLRFIGTASYSIYLVDWPFTAYMRIHGAVPSVAALCAVLAGIAFWVFVERPLTQPQTRMWIEQLFERQRDKGPPRTSDHRAAIAENALPHRTK